MRQLLRGLPRERLEHQIALLDVVSQRLPSLSRADRAALAMEMMPCIAVLPVPLRGGVLSRLAAAVADGKHRPVDVAQRILALASSVGEHERGHVLSHCIESLFRKFKQHIELANWVDIARSLPSEGALTLLAQALQSVAYEPIPLELIPAILDIAKREPARDGMPSALRTEAVGRLLLVTSDRRRNVPDASRAIIWDALFDIVVARLQPDSRPYWWLFTLHGSVGKATHISSEFAAPRLARIEAFILEQPFLSRRLFEKFKGVRISADTASEQYAMAWRCLQEVRGHDAATQARLFVSGASMFVPHQWRDHKDAWRAIYKAGLERIDALEPSSLRSAPLRAWGMQLRSCDDPVAWAMVAERAVKLPEAEAAGILAASIQDGENVQDLAGYIHYARMLAPESRATALKQLVGHVTRAKDDEQQAHFDMVLAAVRELPPQHRATVIPSLIRATPWLRFAAMDLMLPDIEATLPLLMLSRHAAMVADLAGRVLLGEARNWVLAQLSVLETRQGPNAIHGEPLVPYRAEILRRLLFGMTREGHATESLTRWPMETHWPAVRAALERVEPAHRQAPMEVLRAMLPELGDTLSDDVVAVLSRLSAPEPHPAETPVPLVRNKRGASELERE